MIRKEVYLNRMHDPRINYRGANASRLDNVTDAVFGIAITLLIFNMANPNSFEDLIGFAKTLPAFLLSISFLLLIWNEHFRFSEIYTLNDTGLIIFNTIFLAMIIFFVYPLRFLALYMTGFLFQTDLGASIQPGQMHYLMIFYGLAIFGLYFIIYLFYARAMQLKSSLNLNDYEIFLTRWQKKRIMLMFMVPLLSVILTWIISYYSIGLAGFIGGMTYWLFWPIAMLWEIRFRKKSVNFENAD